MSNIKKLTIKDIAAKANVSTATVSRYLNGQLNQMSEKTAAKLKKIIKETAYIRNSAAVQLAKQKSNLIAVIASNIDEYFSSEYFKGIVSILSAQGYIGVLFDSNSDKIIESALLESVYNQNFAGLILQPLSTDRHLIEKFSNNHIPVVLIDRDIGNGEISTVTTNNFQITKFAMTNFLDKGFKKVTIITEPVNDISTRVERVAGARSVFDNVQLIEVDTDHLDLAELSDKIDIKNPKNFLFVLKERLLIQLIANTDLLNETNSQQRLTGFIDTNIPKYLAPKYKFIQQSPYLMGATAAEILMAQFLEQHNTDIKQIVIPSRFE
ncbi:LacI family DNA-binding transcriptional regulator [Leuconostoc gelidum]|uniref:LacI family DNA-binding transcriptional regulator n=1 Tax=Leuconostoc gelidum TaxID=1244 RepID=UPI0002193CD3|nr:LacI family DNA-binding transcriptional regulator [Leuconostoc gelidum]AFS40419.1 HTH-type transcriptional regulator KdgR [Leuconostoc gelidum JB7]MBZ5978364.1 LacI family DNA-binding transcriptional regulator [Leuconostoc gelidum subsp. gelidum]MBZ5992683.1 LacI family DNA-binding transcriptional regulator [Leuconostoc gelidum subsp. gelidum]USP16399.1 LacI family DNA-binding transcriptional regulator [Leuconostoc gelidum subsp. aenigmaticum]GMA68225.1 KDG operon repressor [Leuconostoc gel